jgi:hypothetical protein
LNYESPRIYIPVSKASVINALKGYLKISPAVLEQCLLAFSASSQSSHRLNSESSSILVCRVRKVEALTTATSQVQRNWEKELSGSNSSRLSLVVQQELLAKDPD